MPRYEEAILIKGSAPSVVASIVTDLLIEREERIMNTTIKPKTGPADLAKCCVIATFDCCGLAKGYPVLGDHFYMIALPWLVLQLTGDSLAMGTVLALSAIPRALLMLLGGALTDRFSVRSMMLTSNLARFILVSILTALGLRTKRTVVDALHAGDPLRGCRRVLLSRAEFDASAAREAGTIAGRKFAHTRHDDVHHAGGSCAGWRSHRRARGRSFQRREHARHRCGVWSRCTFVSRFADHVGIHQNAARDRK